MSKGYNGKKHKTDKRTLTVRIIAIVCAVLIAASSFAIILGQF